jgi:pimeloyl-ACP methyl ester carboxylesterase
MLVALLFAYTFDCPITLMQEIMMAPFTKRLISIAVLTVSALVVRETAAAAAPPACAGEAICREKYVQLGGIDQWIWIAGEHKDNPVLLVVHGGPGDVQWPEERRYEPWENAFTVVLWDQRGAGHTYGRYGARTPDMTLQRIAGDGVDLARYLARSLGKQKIIVLGHSWGTMVAIRMVQMAPELFAAYVGTGQVTDSRAMGLAQYGMILAKASEDEDSAELKALHALGTPDPADARQYFSYMKYLSTVMAPSDRRWLKSLRAGLPALEARHPKETRDLLAGMRFSGARLWKYETSEDLTKTARKLDTPFFVIVGSQDAITPTSLAVGYFNLVQAPYKRLVMIPHAGHFAFMTSPSVFLGALIRVVRPIAIAHGA